MNNAWIIFISSDNYLYYAINIYKCLLDVESKYPLYCGITDSVSAKTISILEKIGIKTIKLNTNNIINSKALKKSKECQKYKNAFTKFGILNEEQFDKIVYLDSDLHIFENIDELFDKPHMSAVIDLAPYKKITKYNVGDSVFCSGLFVFDFKNHKDDAKNILNSLNSLPDDVSWHDQNVLNYYYKDWKDTPELHLDPTYGLMTDPRTINKLKSPKIRHYVMGGKEYVPFTKKVVHYETTIFIPVVEYYIYINNTVKWANKTFNLQIPELNLENIAVKNKDGTVLKNVAKTIQELPLANKLIEEKKDIHADGRPNAYLYF